MKATSMLLLVMAMVVQTHAISFNVMNYGAKADGKTDDGAAIEKAWNEACHSSMGATINVVIPNGTYMVGSVQIQGPCQAQTIAIQADGAHFLAPVDPAVVRLQYAWFTFQNVDGLRMSGGIFDGQGQMAWKLTNCAFTGLCGTMPMNMCFNAMTNSEIYNLTSLDSKYFHIQILNSNNVSLHRTVISAPSQSPNTDGIHIGRSFGINITGADIRTGDDCVSLGDGSQQVRVEGVQCGPGHGIAVGSLGRYVNEEPVVGITVRNCTLTETMRGVRVKTWPASPSSVIATDLQFEDIVMNNVGTPILIDQEYCPYNLCQAAIPSRVRISNVGFKNIRGTSATELAVQLICSKGSPCRNVKLTDINLSYVGVGPNATATSECVNVSPQLAGYLFPPVCTLPNPN